MASTAATATTKDAFLENLLTASSSTVKIGGNGPLVQEIGPDGSVVVQAEHAKEAGPSVMPPTPPVVEGPSMLEMMMAAQKEAQIEKNVIVQEEVKKATKTFGSGFKKGFFGGGGGSGSSSAKAPAKAASGTTTSTAAAKPSTAKPTPPTDIPTIVKPTHASSTKLGGTTAAIAEEVKRAMTEEESPVLRQLKQGDWVTPDLVQVFAANPIISRGLQDPKCKAAMQLMQQDPKAAQKRFEGDPDVDLFMREFGKVMAAHFDGLGQQQAQAQSQAQSSSQSPQQSQSQGQLPGQKQKPQNSGVPLITEANSAPRTAGGSAVEPGMGPLQASAMERHKNNANGGVNGSGSGSGSSSIASSGTGTGSGTSHRGADGKTDEERDAQRVQEIVQDSELSALLLDVDMQRILQECGDPIKYRKHMSDPATAYKIKRLFEAGLVATVT